MKSLKEDDGRRESEIGDMPSSSVIRPRNFLKTARDEVSMQFGEGPCELRLPLLRDLSNSTMPLKLDE